MAQGSLGPPSYYGIFVRWRSFAQIGCDWAPRNGELGEQKSLTVVSAKPIVVHEQINKATDGFGSFDRGSAPKTNFASKRRNLCVRIVHKMAQDRPGFPRNADLGQKSERASTPSNARGALALGRGKLRGGGIEQCALGPPPKLRRAASTVGRLASSSSAAMSAGMASALPDAPNAPYNAR